jgi:glycosyltransferase involved in cell wall biosynthesis
MRLRSARWRSTRSTENSCSSTSPLISVLIPTFNRAESLCEVALPSVLNQTWWNIEVIVACHGLNEDLLRTQIYKHGEYSGWILSPWGSPGPMLSDPRIRVIDVPRTKTYPPTAENHWLAGPVQPLNAALAVAKGDWLARIDDDDEWDIDHLEKLLAFATAGNYEFVSSQYTRLENGLETVITADGQRPPIGGTQTWLWRSYLRFIQWNRHCWRKKWNKVNDTDVAERMRRAGVRIGYLPEPTAIIYPREGERFVGSRAYLEDPEDTEERYSFE